MASKSKLRWFALGALLLLVAIFAAPLLEPRDPAPRADPSPNGYYELVKAGGSVIDHGDDIYSTNQATLRALLATNSEALHLLTNGLSKECAVPAANLAANLAASFADLVPMKRLAQLKAAEGRLAELDGKPAAAAENYLICLQVGSALSHGGTIVQRLVGIACEAIGEIPLSRVLPQLSCEEARSCVKTLERIDTVSWDDVMRNERRFIRAHNSGWRHPLESFEQFLSRRLGCKVNRAARQRNDAAAARRGLLLVELALHAYRCDYGRSPASLQQLVPAYLTQVPVDPFSRAPLVYRPAATNWLLYSVGPDQTDDGGRPIGKHNPDTGLPTDGLLDMRKGDISYDSPL